MVQYVKIKDGPFEGENIPVGFAKSTWMSDTYYVHCCTTIATFASKPFHAVFVLVERDDHNATLTVLHNKDGKTIKLVHKLKNEQRLVAQLMIRLIELRSDKPHFIYDKDDILVQFLEFKPFIAYTPTIVNRTSVITHYNSVPTYKVYVTPEDFSVFVINPTEDCFEYNGYPSCYTSKVISQTKYTEIFFGKDALSPKNDNNTVLIHVGKKKYVVVYDDVYSFIAPEKITHYASPVGPSDVPYPYAMSKSYVYLLAFRVYFRKESIDMEKLRKHSSEVFGYGPSRWVFVPNVDKGEPFKESVMYTYI